MGPDHLTDHMILNQDVNVPPASLLVGGLEPHSPYAVRVSCHSSQGASVWTPWLGLHTSQGGRTHRG